MTGRSKVPSRGLSGLGVRTHSGWAAYVVLGGVIEAPDILARGIMTLCDSAIDGSKQPFHHAEPMPFGEAERFIDRCRSSSQALADRAVVAIQAEVGPLRGGCILASSGRSLPGLKEVLASHALIHAAEGDFYRDVVDRALTSCGIRTERVRERDVAHAADRLPGTERRREETIAAFGKKMGPPWRQDEKLAALAAWFALAAKGARSPAGTRTR